MPVHDWTRVDAGTFHDFHCAWIIHLKETLNDGLLPEGYYAMAEQHAGRSIADVLTLQVGDPQASVPPARGAIAVAEAPPQVSRKTTLTSVQRALRRTLAIRHVSGHRVVALLEILSPANKDRAESVREFTEKACSTLSYGCHLLVVDLFPPGPSDPRGMHGAIRAYLDQAEYDLPPAQPLTLAAYVAHSAPDAYLEHLAVGDALPDMPLFLDGDYYVKVPLETTYQAAYRGAPAWWRSVVEGGEGTHG